MAGKPGQGSKRTPGAEDRLVTGISEGIPLQQLCREPGMPAWRTVYDWMEQDEAFAARIARARDVGADAIAAQTLDIVDEAPERGPDGKIDPGWVQHQKLRAEHRLKLLAKWSPKRYGDRIETAVTGNVTLLYDDAQAQRMAERLLKGCG